MISVFFSADSAIELLESVKARRIAALQAEIFHQAHELGLTCSLTAAELYDLELHGCTWDFSRSAVNVSAIYQPTLQANRKLTSTRDGGASNGD